jgi:TonB family protein
MLKKPLITMALGLLTFFGFGQESFRLFLDSSFNETDSAHAVVIRSVEIDDNRFFITDQNTLGQTIHYGEYSSVNPWIREGISRYYLEPDELYAEGYFRENQIAGQWVYHIFYGSEPDTVNYDVPEAFLEFSDCETLRTKVSSNRRAIQSTQQVSESLKDFFDKNLRVPARSRSITRYYAVNNVTFSFLVDVNGNIKCPQIDMGIDDDFEKEILRLLYHFKPPLPNNPIQVSFEYRFFEKQPEDEIVFVVVEEQPHFGPDPNLNGFPEYIAEMARNSEVAKERGYKGTVYVNFVVNEDGSVSNVRALRPGDPVLDLEAIRLVSASPKWKPGKQMGKAVKVRFNVPVRFE